MSSVSIIDTHNKYGAAVQDTQPVGTEKGLVVRVAGFVEIDGIVYATVAGGAKGITPAATVTASAIDADHNALDVYVRGAAGGGLTNAELRASAVPVSGPVTDAQLRASAVPVSGPLTDAQLRASTVPVTATQGTAAAANAPWAFRVSDGTSFYDIAKTGQLPAALVGGRLDANNGAWLGSTAPTVGQKAMASSLPVVIASDQATFPVTATQGTAAGVAAPWPVRMSDGAAFYDGTKTGQLPSALVGARLDINNGAWLGSTAPTVGSKTSANSIPVVIASDQGAFTVTANIGTAGTLALDAHLTDGTQRTKITDGTNNAAVQSTPAVGTEQGLVVRIIDKPTTLHVTATAAVNTASTCTLPAAGAGLFHYITNIQLVKLYSVIGVAAGAGVIVTSTNLPGNPAWTTEQLASAAGTAPVVINFSYPGNPLKSSAANTATTFVAPLQLQTIWRWNVSYYTGN